MSPIETYTLLIKRFVTGEITPSQFEMAYLSMFLNQLGLLPQGAYEVLNDLFMDVDAYCSDPNLRDEDDLDDQALLDSAKEALLKLS